MLLDTQVLVWFLNGSGRLGSGTRSLIERSARAQFSAASVWELTIKAMLGKIDLGPDFDSYLLESRLSELPVTGVHGRALSRFPQLLRHDPFDRILVAQADMEGVPLVTADRVLLATGGFRTLDARL